MAASPPPGAAFVARARRAAPWLLLLFPVAIFATTWRAVSHNLTPAPWMDYWESIWWWRKLLAEPGAWPDFLLLQHNEHRLVWPRLIFLADLKWFEGRGVLNIAAIAAFQLAGAAMFLRAAREGFGRWIVVAGLALGLAILFSLTQWENLFWDFQVAFVGAFVAGAWGMLLFCEATDGRLSWIPLGAAMLLLAAAVGSLASGVGAGISMVMLALLGRRGLVPVLVAALTTAVLLGLYMIDFQPTAPAGDLRTPEPLDYPLYLMTYLGSLWGVGGRIGVAMVTGGAGLLLSLAMLVQVARGRASSSGQLALFGVVLFVGMTAALTTLGRAGLGLDQAMASRYATPGTYFWAAQAVFWALQAADARWAGWRVGAAVALAAGAVGTAWAQLPSLASVRPLHEVNVVGASALAGGLDDTPAYKRLYPDPGMVRDLAPFLRQQRLSVFAGGPDLIAGARLPTQRIAPSEACFGAFDIIEAGWEGSPHWRAIGWGWDREGGRPFAKVVLADEAAIMTGMALGSLPRPDVPRVVRQVRTAHSGWTGLSEVRAGQALTAYGILADGRFCPIGRKAGPT